MKSRTRAQSLRRSATAYARLAAKAERAGDHYAFLHYISRQTYYVDRANRSEQIEAERTHTPEVK